MRNGQGGDGDDAYEGDGDGFGWASEGSWLGDRMKERGKLVTGGEGTGREMVSGRIRRRRTGAGEGLAGKVNGKAGGVRRSGILGGGAELNGVSSGRRRR